MSSSTPPPNRRSSKACENCRIRRIKCEPPYPCQACRTAGLLDCTIRDKARPNRQVLSTWRQKFHRPANSVSPPTGDYQNQGRVDFLQIIERDLERVYEGRTGSHIDLQLPDDETSALLSLDSPLPPLPGLDDGLTTLDTFCENILPFFSFLSSARVRDLFGRYFTVPGSMSDDQIALLYACMALGRLRKLSVRWDGGRESHVPFSEARDDVAWYRHSIDRLTKWGSASFTALQSLILLQLYAMCAGSVASTRRVIAKMVWQARELNIHHKQTADAYPPEEHADIIFFYVIFSDCYYSTLCGLPPYFKHGDFDLALTPPSEATGHRDFAFGSQPLLIHLVLLQSELLKQIHEGTTDTMSTDFVLRFEAKWTNWLDAFIAQQRSTGSALADNFCTVHYHWDRIMLRSACIAEPLLTVSSLAIIARSATQILLVYRAIYRTRQFNLAWPHLRRVVTCGQLILQCYWRYELQKEEAETAMRIAFELLDKLALRWKSATTARASLWELTRGLGIDLSPPAPNPWPTPQDPILPLMDPDTLFNGLDDGGMFDFLLDTSLWAIPRTIH